MHASLDWDTEPDAVAAKFGDFLDALEDELEDAVDDIVELIASSAEDGAPVDTGELRDSIEGQVEEAAGLIVRGKVAAEADHAPFQEFGTIFQAPQPYLAPAIDAHRDDFVARVETAVENAKREAFG